MTTERRTAVTKFFVLGPVQAERAGRILNLGGPKQRMLMAALLLAANRVMSVDRLMEILWWDHAHERSSATLHVYVAKLRRVIGRSHDGASTVIETVRPGYRIHADERTLDLLAFESLSRRARGCRARGDLAGASQLFRAALRIPRGELAADFVDEPFVREATPPVERAILTVTAEAYECELDLGRHHETLADLERLAAEHPLDEHFARLLMLALYRSGRQVDALEVYRRLREKLTTELGIDPGPELQQLQRMVLNHDPVLAAQATRPATLAAPSTFVGTSTPRASAILVVDGVRHGLTRVVTTVGRLPDQTVVLPDKNASRRHAEVRRTSAGFVLVDVGSTNGTRVNGHRVTEHVLVPGDRIEIGDTTLVFEEP